MKIAFCNIWCSLIGYVLKQQNGELYPLMQGMCASLLKEYCKSSSTIFVVIQWQFRIKYFYLYIWLLHFAWINICIFLFRVFLKIIIHKHMHIFCILNMSNPATINPSSSHWLTLYCSSHVMQSSAGLLWYYNVFDIHCGGAVHDGNNDIGTFCIYHICQLGMTLRIISIFKNSCKWHRPDLNMWFSMNNGSYVS